MCGSDFYGFATDFHGSKRINTDFSFGNSIRHLNNCYLLYPSESLYKSVEIRIKALIPRTLDSDRVKRKLRRQRLYFGAHVHMY